MDMTEMLISSKNEYTFSVIKDNSYEQIFEHSTQNTYLTYRHHKNECFL